MDVEKATLQLLWTGHLMHGPLQQRRCTPWQCDAVAAHFLSSLTISSPVSFLSPGDFANSHKQTELKVLRMQSVFKILFFGDHAFGRKLHEKMNNFDLG